MTEQEWVASNDPKPMLRYLIGTDSPRVQDVEVFLNSRGSGRKLRLFACACYFRISHFLPNENARNAVRIIEQFTDGTARMTEFMDAASRVLELLRALEPRWQASTGVERSALHPEHAALSLAWVASRREPQKAAWYASSNASHDFPYLANPGVDVHSPVRWEAEASEKRAQCKLLREIFGNPFCPVTFASEWRSDTALSLAKHIYESRDFEQMPILADALQDAGCDNAEVLSHCRDSSATHVRGCWVVDLILGKS